MNHAFITSGQGEHAKGHTKNDLLHLQIPEVLPDHQHAGMSPRSWFVNPYRIVVLLVGLFILISGSTGFLVYQHFRSTLDKTLRADQSIANIFHELLREHQIATIGILESYASRPLLIKAVKEKDLQGVHIHMADLKKNNKEMDLTFLTDKNGILWANYPVFPEALGKDLSNRDWYKGIINDWKPYISRVFKLIVGNRPLAVAVCVPIRDNHGNVVGILGNSHRLSFIDDMMQRIHLTDSIQLSVIDREGNIIFSKSPFAQEHIIKHPLFPVIVQKINEKKDRFSVHGPPHSHEKTYVTLSTMNKTGWTVVVERPLSAIIRSEYSHMISVCTIALLLFMVIAVFTVYQHVLLKKTTGQLNAEMLLKHSEERFKRLIDHIPDILYLYSSQRGFLFFSPSIESILGYTPFEMYNKPTFFRDSIHRQDQARVANALDGIVTQGHFDIEYRIVDKNGHWRWLSDRAIGLHIQGNEVIIEGLAVDITQRKIAENALSESIREYNDMVAQIPVGIFKYRVKPENEIEGVYISPRWCDIMNLRKDEVLDHPKMVFELIHPEDRDSMIDAVAHAWNTETLMEWEGRFIIKNQERFMKIQSIPQKNESGDTLWTGIQYDITREKNLENQNRLQQISKTKSLNIMAGAIAHKFNNLLNAVMGNLELLLEDEKSTLAKASLSAALHASQQAAEVSRMMLIYLGHNTGQTEPLNLSAVCDQSLINITPFLQNNVRLSAELTSPGPVVKANAYQIQQILTHLITNAREAMGDHEGLIRLCIKTVSHDAIPSSHRFPLDWQHADVAYACLEVSDNGCGIPEEDIDKLFDPFFTSKFTGRGLGLSVVLGLVKAYQGAVAVESTPGQGSVFRVFIPVSDEILQVKTGADPAANLMGGGTLLLVEDETAVRKMVSSLLERMGFAVLEAGDGVEALDLFMQNKDAIRLVVSDLTMPRMDGWGLLDAIRRIAPDFPVILNSGYHQNHVMTGDHKEQPQCFLHKPYRLEDLRKAIFQTLKPLDPA